MKKTVFRWLPISHVARIFKTGSALEAAAKRGGVTPQALCQILAGKAPQELTDYFIEQIKKSRE